MNILEGTHLIPNATIFSTATATDIPPETKILLWMTPDPLPELPENLDILVCPRVKAVNSVPNNLCLLVVDIYATIACQLPPHCRLFRNASNTQEYVVKTYRYDAVTPTKHAL